MACDKLSTPHGDLALPAFLPDATRAVVRGVDAQDLSQAGVRGLMVNSFHVARRPGVRQVRELGGLHRFMGWSGPIVTDSGGFQVLSLIRQEGQEGQIRPKGVLFRDPETNEKVWLTPEVAVRNQLVLGADVVIGLDDCTGLDSSPEEQIEAVDRTIKWFQRSRQGLDQLLGQTRTGTTRPPLVGVVQGGRDGALRRRCADALLEAGAEAIGFGGWPIDKEGRLLLDMFESVLAVVPDTMPLFALGVGKPEHLVALTRLRRGVVFDCSLPTRDARHHRLYAFEGDWPRAVTPNDTVYQHVYIADAAMARAEVAVDAACDCACCRHYSRAYLHHLIKVKDGLFERLATIHNLRFYTRLVEGLRHG